MEQSITTRSPGLASTTLPANQLVDSCDQLMVILRALALKCDSPKVENPSARKVLSDLQSHVLDACVLVQRAKPDFSEVKASDPFVAPATVIGYTMGELVRTFNRTEQQLDRFRLSPEFTNHIDAALKLKSLFNAEAYRVINALLSDYTSLRPVLRELSIASKKFVVKWNQVLDKARNVSDPKQTYSALLRKEWKSRGFKMEPTFPESMDILSIPSVEEEMQRLGRNWAKDLLAIETEPYDSEKGDDPELQKHLNFLRVISKASEAIKKDSKDIPSSSLADDLQEFHLPIEAASKWPEIIKQLGFDRSRQYLRIFVLGGVKQGKTSIINSLIGRVLLHSGSMAATAWPLIVRHAPGKKIPTLHIDPKHFEPFIRFIQRQNYSARSKTVPEPTRQMRRFVHELGPTGLSDLDIGSRMAKLLKPGQLERFENPEFKFPVKSSGVEAVYNTMKDINTLMRFCYALAGSATTPFPPLENLQWPRLDVEFDAWGSKEVYLEMLDLPVSGVPEREAVIDAFFQGLDEPGTKMPQHIFEHAVAHGVDGCLMALLRNMHTHNATTQMMTLHSMRTRDPPLVVFVTYSETGGEDAEIRETVASQTWSDVRGLPRIVFCAPGLYASLVSVLENSFTKEELAMPRLPDPTGYLKSYEDFQKTLPCWLGVTAALSQPAGPRVAEKYNKATRQGWKNALEEHFEKCNHEEVLDHFQKYILEQGTDRRQLYALTETRSDLRRLMATQSDLISMLLNVHLGSTTSMSVDLTTTASTTIESWRANGIGQNERMRKSLEKELEEIRMKAENVVNRAIELEIPNHTRNIKTAEEAVNMINSLQDFVKPALDQLAMKHVTAIRDIAKQAWDHRVRSLLNMLLEVRLRLPSELISTLRATAVDPSQALREDTTKRLAEVTKDLKEAEEYWKNTVEKPWLPYQAALAEAGGFVTPRPPVIESIIVASLNELGYLFRPVVPGDATVPSLLGDPQWPLTYPEDVTYQQVNTILANRLIDPWIQNLGSDSQKSVIGAMKMATEIASGHVKSIIESRLEWYDKAQDFNASIVDSRLIDKIVLQQARCCLLYGAIDAICKKWMSSMSVILPQTYWEEVDEIELDESLAIADEKETDEDEDDEDDEGPVPLFRSGPGI